MRKMCDNFGDIVEKKLKDYTNEELDQIELQSYRTIENLQAELQRWGQNLQVIKLERANRESVQKKELKAV